MKAHTYIVCSLMVITLSCSYLPEEAQSDLNSYILDENADFFMVYDGMLSPERIILFVPGAFVDPYAYVDWMLDVSNDEIAVVALKYPSNFALSNVDLYEKIIEKYDYVSDWIIAGHSLGGVVASKIVLREPALFKGLILLGSYTTSVADLHSWNGSVLSISATEDAFTTPQDVEDNKIYLPDGEQIESTYVFQELEARSFYYSIEGGNHSNFGNYGLQKGDNEASISKEEQWAEMTGVMNAFIDALVK